MLNIAEFSPMPSASTPAAAMVNPGVFSSWRIEVRKSSICGWDESAVELFRAKVPKGA